MFYQRSACPNVESALLAVEEVLLELFTQLRCEFAEQVLLDRHQAN
jgi:hypothetical protein